MTVITLHYTEALVRRAVRVFCWRTLGWTYLSACLLLLLALSWLLSTGDRSWMVGVWAAVLAMGVAFGVALYWVHHRTAMARLRRMRMPEATIELGEERFRLSSDLGTSELAWTAVSEVWSSSEFVLVFLGKAQFFTLPMADLGSEAREVILAKAGASGAKVVQV